MKALIKITPNILDYTWLKSEMGKTGFIPKETDDQIARYKGPHYEFYWNGPYTTEELFEKIRKIISIRNDSVTESAALINSEISIRHLN